MPEYGRTTGDRDGSWHVTMITHEDVPGRPAVPGPARDPGLIARELILLIRKLAAEPGTRIMVMERVARIERELDGHAAGRL